MNTLVAAEAMRESWRKTQTAAEALGVKVVSLEVRGPNPDFEGAFQTATSERVDALMFQPGGVLLNLHRKRVVELAARSRLPAIYSVSEFVDDGGLMSYAPDYDDLYRRAATYVDKILKGAKPADLPIGQPTKFELVINTNVAEQIELPIPPNVLARADRVIR